jgi:6-phosphogluconolactonase
MKHQRLPIIVGFLALFVVGCGSASPGIAAARPFVYVANKGRNSISQFNVSRSGTLTPLTPATVASGPFPNAIAVSPQGNNAYVVDAGAVGAPANEISQYSINPITGQLTPKSPATVTTGNGDAIAVTPNGTSVYVADTGGVSQYSVNPITGDLTPKTPARVHAGGGPTAIAVTPNGKSLYVANIEANTISQYNINPITGNLTSKAPATVHTGDGPQFIRIAPGGNSAYVIGSGSGKSVTRSSTAGRRGPNGGKDGAVSQYTINPRTGDLNAKSPATVPIADGPHDLAIAPDGKDAYVVTVLDNTVSQYRINPRTGTLSPKPTSAATTGLHPENILITPNGKNAYVDSENDSTVSQYTINPSTGKIARMSPATVATASGSIGMAITP